jgi:drug/metabolite transporter (DMT)-like permease
MKLKNLLLLILLASLWGPSFLFIKIAVVEISPLQLAALRIGLAAVLINVFLMAKGQRLTMDLKFWKHVMIAGFFAHSLPFLLINWGEQYIDSGLASILNGLTPLSTVVLANFMVNDEKLTGQKIVGVLLGFVGLLVLILPNMLAELEATQAGIVAVTIGAISYGVAIVYSKRHLKNSPSMHAPSAQLLGASVYLIPLSVMVESPANLLHVSWEAMGSVLILAVFGTAIAFIVYYKILENTSASYLSLVTYLMPIYGVILGVLFMNEIISKEMIGGMALILVGIMVVNYKRTVAVAKPIAVAVANKSSVSSRT